MQKELDYDDALDALRCAYDECGSGLSVPCEVGGASKRCVHCGGEWEDEF